MTWNTTQLVACAIALAIAWILGRLSWRFANNVAGPVEDWFDDNFEVAPAVARLAMLAVALLVFLALSGTIGVELWRHTADLLGLASHILKH
jgi:hypothetical protein